MSKSALLTRFIASFLFLLLFATKAFSQITLVSYGSTWKYWSNSQANFPTGWNGVSYNDSGWPSGGAEMGYGDGDETICIPSGGGGTLCAPSGNKWVTAYFRYSVNITDVSLYSNFILNVERDDGCVVYVNGQEVGRNNMPTGAINWATAASSAIEDGIATFSVTTGAGTPFQNGTNIIAVEIHQASVSGGFSTSSDISFNLEMLGTDNFSSGVTRGPYLQMGNQTAVTFRWRTGTAQNSRIELGTVYGSYPIVVNDAASVTEHVVRVTGLTPDTKYFYRIGNSTGMSLPDPDKFLRTVPPATATRKIRIAAFGDCGRNSSTYQDQNLLSYRNYLNANGIDAPDAFILMGDNAYSSGTDAEYSSNFFGIYGSSILKNHKLYPAPGNHDYGNNTANKPSRTMPYYQNFTVPQNAECGGVASNKPNFYSYDIGNIHFLSLDSWGTESDGSHMGSVTSQMKTWINDDLAANTKKWTIAYWHHSPYTKTSHNSDTESELAAIRTNFIRYLEVRGVDMIICGHSHGYERSYLLRNYSDSWLAFNPLTHAVNTSSATYTSNTTCPYSYNTTPLDHGTVYVVAGSAGASGGTVPGEFATGPMPFALNDAGMFFIEVEENRLTARMLRSNGNIFDQFTMVKDANRSTVYNVGVNTAVTLTASWPGVYNWNTSATSRSIVVTPSVVGTTNYTVTDAFGCITDQFTVNALSTLPVELREYSVVLVNDKVRIDWSTISETGNLYFTVERSSDGINFETIGKINGRNSQQTEQYSYTDANPIPGKSYYRLAQTDAGLATKYFDSKKIQYDYRKSFYVKIVNKGSNSIGISITSARTSSYSFRVLETSGKEIRRETVTVAAGSVMKDITLNKGAYVVELINLNGERISQLVLVQ
jgi:acid phosphatase type 7